MTRMIMRNGYITLVALFGVTALAIAQNAPDARPAIPPTPAPVQDVVSIQKFSLETPSSHLWRAEKPMVRTGYILVLKVDPTLVYPRQIAEPVLYVGNQTAERLNVGYDSGHVVAVVPAVIDPDHADYLDLNKALMWFGTPELPERVTANRIAQEHALAVEAGITPIASTKLETAARTGGALNAQASKSTLVRDAMRRLVRRYSPQERALVDGILKDR